MVSINIVNSVICVVIYKRSLSQKDEKNLTYRKRMRIMGVIFTLVALYRSIFVSKYSSQLAWFNSIANSSLLIRSIATVAELSFSGLIALAMLQFNKYLPSTDDSRNNKFKSFVTTKSPYILVASIFVAQFFDTSCVITKFELLGAISETFWSIGFLAILPLAIMQVHLAFSIKDKAVIERLRKVRDATIIIAAWCVIYCIYGLFFHLPGLWTSAINQLETGVPPIKTGPSAVRDAFMIVHVTREYSDWGFNFLLWHSAYFTLLVWISLFLMQAPRPMEVPVKRNTKLTLLVLTVIAITIITLLLLIIMPMLY